MPDSEFQRRMLERMDEFCERQERIEMLLTGNGQPGNGLVVRVDRIEQNERRRDWWIRTTIAAAFTAVATAGTALGAAVWKKIGG
jgi:hypothetical protein